MLGWHVLDHEWRTNFGASNRRPWKVGEKRSTRGEPEICHRGYHFCTRLVDALGWSRHLAGSNPIICRVEVPDDYYYRMDKGVAKWRRLIAGDECKDVFNEFAKVCIYRAFDYNHIPRGQADLALDGKQIWKLRTITCATLAMQDAIIMAVVQDGVEPAMRTYWNVSHMVGGNEWATEWLEPRVKEHLNVH